MRVTRRGRAVRVARPARRFSHPGGPYDWNGGLLVDGLGCGEDFLGSIALTAYTDPAAGGSSEEIANRDGILRGDGERWFPLPPPDPPED